jgi:glycosyltransferase involved in cell wall biosynthesis
LANIPAEKIKVVYPWMEPRFNPDFAGREAARVRSTYGLPKKFFLYVGGYDYRKNVEFLLEAYALARRKSELPPLVLAGTIPAKKASTVCDVPGAMERNGLKAGRDVFLPGFIADCDMPGLYGAGELLVYPSLYEGFGFPPVEAIACGKPVLVADNSSLKEIITTPQNRFSTDDPAILASLLLSAQQDPGQFSSKLESRFTEDYAMAAYLEALRIAFD